MTLELLCRRCSDHESARLRHLALKKVTKRDVLDKSAAELSVARQAADESRYELARHLNTVGLTLLLTQSILDLSFSICWWLVLHSRDSQLLSS